MKSIYVGNLPYDASEEDVRELFERYGPVDSVRMMSDRDTGRPRGFGFVSMEDEGADAAIKALDGSAFGGRNLRVNQAEERGAGRGGGGGRQGGRW